MRVFFMRCKIAYRQGIYDFLSNMAICDLAGRLPRTPGIPEYAQKKH